MKGLIIPSLVILATGFLVEVADADMDRARVAEREQVVQVLKEGGCIYVDDVKVEGDYYRIDDVVCNDGKRYNLVLDRNFNVVTWQEDGSRLYL